MADVIPNKKKEDALSRRIRKLVCQNIATNQVTECSLPGIGRAIKCKHRYAFFFWVLLILSCIGISIYQTWDRIDYWNAEHAVVDVSIDYTESITFPDISICATHHHTMHQIYKQHKLNIDEDNIDCFIPLEPVAVGTTNISATEIWNYANTSHALISVKADDGVNKNCYFFQVY